MNPASIRVESLSKSYHLVGRSAPYKTMRDALTSAVKAPLAWLQRTKSEPDGVLWALRDVSFEVKSGDAVAVIGRNGAGKSTLLKILARITEPSSGCVELRGRVASLLEIGTGFHHELSGRENIYLNGAILGMRKAEIDRTFDRIVEFAGVGEFLDEPVKHYSSGMYMRLAFAVAAHLEPDILVIDEVLAVGDTEFQQRCLGRVNQLARSGRTVLFVTHDMQAAVSLCNKGILLERGRVVAQGDIQSVAERYMSTVDMSDRVEWRGDAGGEKFRLRLAQVSPQAGRSVLMTDQPLHFQFRGEILRPLQGFVFGVELWSSRQQFLAYSAYDDREPPPAPLVAPGTFARELVIPANTLAPGTYELRLDIGLHHKERLVDSRNLSLQFHLENAHGLGRRFSGSWTHMFRSDWQWNEIA